MILNAAYYHRVAGAFHYCALMLLQNKKDKVCGKDESCEGKVVNLLMFIRLDCRREV